MRKYLIAGLGVFLGLAAALAGTDTATAPATQSATQPASVPATQPWAGRVKELIRDLRGKDPKARLAAVRELGRMGSEARPAMPALTTIELDDKEAMDESESLLKKLMPVTEKDLSWLIEWLSDDSELAQRAVLFWLGYIGPPARQAIPAIVEKLKIDSGYELPACAVQALKEIGPEGVEAGVAYLKRALKDKNRRVRYLAADSLHILGIAAKAALPDLQAALADEYDAVRDSVAETLGGWGPQAVAASPSLVPLLKDKSTDVRHKAARSLSQMGKLPAEVVQQLPASLAGQDEYVKLCVAIAMAKSGQNDPWIDRIVEATSKKYERSDSASYYVHMLAVKSLGEIGPVDERVVPTLIAILETEWEFIRMEAAASLAKCGSAAKDAIGPLVKAALEEDEVYTGEDEFPLPLIKERKTVGRDQAAYVLGCIGIADEQAIAAMRKLLKEKPCMLTAKAGFALARMGKADEGLPAILTVLRGDDDAWRVEAAELLGKLGPAARSTIPLLKEAARTVLNASDRRRIEMALSAVGSTIPVSATVPATQPTGQAARTILDANSLKIGLYDDDKAKPGLYAIGPYARLRFWPFNVLYESAASGKTADGCYELIGRMEGVYSPSDEFDVDEYDLEGDNGPVAKGGGRISAHIRYIRSQPQKATDGNGYVWKRAYVWAPLPEKLAPGTYHVTIELVEYLRENGKLVVAPKTATRAFEHLTCTFDVPSPATATTQPASRPFVTAFGEPTDVETIARKMIR